MKKLLILLLCFVTLSTCNGCHKLEPIGDFECFVNNNMNTVFVRGLSEEGKQKEVIMWPTDFGNYKVYIYHQDGYFCGQNFYVESENLKKMYFNTNIIDISVSGHLIETCSNEVTYYIPSYQDEISHFFHIYKDSSNDFYSYEDYLNRKAAGKQTNINKIANISYYYNYEKEGYQTYFIDNVFNETIINIPPNPKRKGYTFDGWYKEKECINIWDFEKEIIPEKMYDSEGNYDYKETIIYAKWK